MDILETLRKMMTSQKSDANLIYDYLLRTKPTRFTGRDIESAIKREDGTTMPYGNVSAALTGLMKRGLIEAFAKEPSSAGAHVQKYIYRFKGEINEPRWSGRQSKKRVRKVFMPNTATAGAGKTGGLASRILSISGTMMNTAADLEKLASDVEAIEKNPNGKLDAFSVELLKRLGVGAGA